MITRTPLPKGRGLVGQLFTPLIRLTVFGAELPNLA